MNARGEVSKNIVLFLYIMFILSVTLAGRAKLDRRIFEPLFWELKNRMWSDILLNIVLFVPLGFFIGCWKGIFIGTFLSCGIEAAQYYFCLGYCELDDVLHNTIGTGIGILAWVAVGTAVLKKWEELPDFMRVDDVRSYWEILDKKRGQLVFKRAFDLIFSVILLALLAVPMAVIAVLIKRDSEGPVFYRQERVTTYGRRFRIHKFRTMVSNADKIGAAVTAGNDSRITKVGAILRRFRLDELPQVIDVIKGDMSFVGTRPEVVKYVEQYKPEYNATLLMPAGITSEASIRYKDEGKLLDGAEDVDKVYVEEVLPGKMVWNLKFIRQLQFSRDISTMFGTVSAVLGKDCE